MMDGNTSVTASSTTTSITGNMATSKVSVAQNTANTKNASKETETTKNEPDGKSTTFVNTPNENPVAAAICVKYTLTTKAATKETTEEATGRFS